MVQSQPSPLAASIPKAGRGVTCQTANSGSDQPQARPLRQPQQRVLRLHQAAHTPGTRTQVSLTPSHSQDDQKGVVSRG